MGKTVKKVFIEAWHGLCTFHIMQNAIKHLAELDNEESGASLKQVVDDNNKEPRILEDFSACMYEYEDEATFEDAFNIMRSKASKQTQLDSIYKVR